jgi:hypothetical protein
VKRTKDLLAHRETTLEGLLHRARQRFVLMADLFELTATTPDFMRSKWLRQPAARAIRKLCDGAAEEIRTLVDALPADLLTWAQGK